MRNFSARETEWLLELDGIALASFRQRAFAFLFDALMITLLYGLLGGFERVFRETGLSLLHMLPASIHITTGPEKEHSEHLFRGVVLPVLYFGLLTWRGQGRTPGKRIFGVRVISLVHHHLSLWHSVERALGYGAATLEGGFGFLQFFIHPYRRCIQDRIAETIVVTESSYRSQQLRLSHPLSPDAPDEIPQELSAPDPPPRPDQTSSITSSI